MAKLRVEVILGILLSIFFILEIPGLSHIENSDENIYFYMGKLVSIGVVPYKDFFFAHPPLKIYISSIIQSLFGFNIFLLKLVSVFSIMVAGFFLFKLVKLHFDPKTALISVVIFLSSYTILSEATYSTGIELTLAFLISGIYFIFSEKYFVGGILLGLASITGLYSLFFIFVLFAFLVFKNQKNLIKTIAGFGLIFIPINLLFFIISSGKYFTSVYLYHLLKPPVAGNTFSVFISVILKNWLVFVLSLASFLVYSRKLNFYVASSVFYCVFLLFSSRIFNFYFVLLIPFLSVLGAFALITISEKFKLEKINTFIFSFAVIISILFTINYLYTFDFIDFNTAHDISDFLTNDSFDSDTIFGDDTSVPLIALISGRSIYSNYVDTNYMTFLSGVNNVSSLIEDMDNSPPKFVIIRPGYNIATIPEFFDFIESRCVLRKTFKSEQWGDFVVYECSS